MTEQIGSYKTLSLLGACGMGEVYRELDLKLGRHVAIKFLPPSLASNSERLRWFAPNIVVIYGLGGGPTNCGGGRGARKRYRASGSQAGQYHSMQPMLCTIRRSVV